MKDTAAAIFTVELFCYSLVHATLALYIFYPEDTSFESELGDQLSVMIIFVFILNLYTSIGVNGKKKINLSLFLTN
jgi:hypothetical protein